MDQHETPDVIVIGAGLAGLVAAATAASEGRRVQVLDPHPPGGRARVDDRAGFAFNRGPRALYVDGPGDRTLQGLGVDTSAGGAPRTAGGAVRIGGALDELPGGPVSAARTRFLTVRDKARLVRALPALLRDRPHELADVTLAHHLDRAGLTGNVRAMVEALVRVGSYANAPGVVAAGPVLANARRGLHPGVRYLDGGWQSLVDQLLGRLGAAGVRVETARATAVRAEGGVVTVALADGSSRTAASVVVAAGGPDAVSALLGGRPASWPTLGPPATAACLELGVRGLPERRFVLGVDEPTYLSTHAPPADLAPEGHAVVHLMRYQPVDDDLPATHQEALLHDVARQAGIEADAIVTERFLARMVVTHALPIAAAGGLAGRVPVAVAEHPGVLLAGDWVGPDGLLLDAVCASGAAAGRRAADRSATMVSA